MDIPQPFWRWTSVGVSSDCAAITSLLEDNGVEVTFYDNDNGLVWTDVRNYSDIEGFIASMSERGYVPDPASPVSPSDVKLLEDDSQPSFDGDGSQENQEEIKQNVSNAVEQMSMQSLELDDNSLLIIKVGSDDRLACSADLNYVQKLFEEKLKDTGIRIVAVHHLIDFAKIDFKKLQYGNRTDYRDAMSGVEIVE